MSSAFLEIADRIGCHLCRDALWDGKRCTWLSWSMEAIDNAWVTAYRSHPAELYSGSSGIALFLAELYRCTQDRQQRRVLEGAVNQSLSLVGGISGVARIGFYSGVTGIAYALARIATLLDNAKLLERSLAELATLASIPPDERLIDVIGGSAGAIPALLALGQAHRRDVLIDIAATHGDHLLKTATRGEHGWSWDTMNVPDQPHLTGHSHGVAGVVTALLELYRVTGETRFRDGAIQGLAYERHLFHPEYCNWPDLRIMNPGAAAPQQPVYNMAWCHGAPGIGLSRLRNWELLDGDEQIRQELDAAIQTTAASLAQPWTPGMGNYSLCHGACGNAELLIMAAERLGRTDLRQIAEKVGWEGQQHYAQTGLPWPCGVSGAGEAANLMLGTAGIGHFYLRLHDPVNVPSVLIVTPAEERVERAEKPKRLKSVRG